MLENLQKELRSLKNPEKAKLLAGFFKTGKGQYGEGDKFLGITVPQTRATIKKYQSLPLIDIAKLLQSEFHEERLAALLILVDQYKKGNKKAQKNIFEFYLKNTVWINSWDLVDLSAPQIVGAQLADKPKNVLFKLARSKLLWNRRIAIVATFFDIKRGSSETALAIAEKLLNDKEDLLHKATGWMLREVGKCCSREEEEIFLAKYAATMPRTMLRYAIEHFPEHKRQLYLNYKKMDNKLLYAATFFLTINLFAFLIMLWDKNKSKKAGAERISEGLLFFMATVFGSLGVYAGMFAFHHKTKKWYFIIGIPMLMLQNVALLYLIYLKVSFK